MEPQASKSKAFFKDFCEQTSQHGWNFLAYSKFKCIHVVFWLFVIIGAFVGCIYNIYQNTEEFIEATVDFQTETLTEPLDNVLFPSIYISNKNVMRKSILMEVLQDPNLTNVSYNQIVHLWTKKRFWGIVSQNPIDKKTDDMIMASPKWISLFKQFLENSFKKPSEHLIYPFTTKLYQSLYDLEILKGREVDLDLVFRNILQLLAHSTLDDFLLMIYFNGQGIGHFGGKYAGEFVPTNTFWPFFNNNGSRSGVRNGITFHLDAETYDFTMNEFQNEGFDIGIKHGMDAETMLDTIDIQAGQVTMVAVSSELMQTDDNIRTRFNFDSTKCYFDGEVNLEALNHKYQNTTPYRYSMKNCLYEAYFQQWLKQCECNSLECFFQVRKCLNERNISLGKHQHFISKGRNRTCYARCNDQTFSTSSISTSQYPNLQSFPYFGFDFCLVMQKIARSCQSIKKLALEDKYPGICTHFNQMDMELKTMLCGYWDYDQVKDKLSDKVIDFVKVYAKENTARVTIYMKDPYVKKTNRVAKISVSSFISNIGGLLGLFQGISVISFFEISYLLCLFVKDKLGKPKSIVSH